MTTLLEQGEAVVVRCDDCRRLWPIQAARLETAGWQHDAETDRHRCPICADDE
jgi:predicted RNA-binding Zn-ribbon protein involved in translation (DUF1610 family)